MFAPYNPKMQLQMMQYSEMADDYECNNSELAQEEDEYANLKLSASNQLVQKDIEAGQPNKLETGQEEYWDDAATLASSVVRGKTTPATAAKNFTDGVN